MLRPRSLVDLFNVSRKVCCARTYCTFKRREFSLDSEYFNNHIPDSQEIDAIEKESKIRKSRGSVQLLRHYFKNYTAESAPDKKQEFRHKLVDEWKKFPNKTHPTVLSYGSDSGQVELYSHGDLHKNLIPNAKSYLELGTMSNTIRMSQLGNFTGARSYYFMHSVADLEEALIRYTTDVLFKEGFEIISVPDILPAELIAGCGMPVDSKSTQVSQIYQLIC